MSRPEGPRSRKLRGELELVEKRLKELEERLEGWWELKGNLEQRTVAKAFVGREGKVVGRVVGGEHDGMIVLFKTPPRPGEMVVLVDYEVRESRSGKHYVKCFSWLLPEQADALQKEMKALEEEYDKLRERREELAHAYERALAEDEASEFLGDELLAKLKKLTSCSLAAAAIKDLAKEICGRSELVVLVDDDRLDILGPRALVSVVSGDVFVSHEWPPYIPEGREAFSTTYLCVPVRIDRWGLEPEEKELLDEIIRRAAFYTGTVREHSAHVDFVFIKLGLSPETVWALNEKAREIARRLERVEDVLFRLRVWREWLARVEAEAGCVQDTSDLVTTAQ